MFEGSVEGWSDSMMHNGSWGQQSRALKVLDVNRDGYEDIAACNEWGGFEFKVYFGGSTWPTTPSINKTCRGREDMAFAVPKGDRGPVYDFDDEVALKYYRLQKISDGSLLMEPGARYAVSGPTSVGTGISRGEEIELSKLIEILN